MILGLDIGGANLKAADTGERAVSVPFALWKDPAGLAGALGDLVARFDRPGRLAVTMTGELCDCFETKAEGVSHILDAVERVAAGLPGAPVPIDVWQTGGEFVPPGVARDGWQLTAAANWHATATFVGRVVPTGTALLVDMGGTTTDLIPLEDGVPVPTGLTDLERLRSGELLYFGAGRTPVYRAMTNRFAGTGDYIPPEYFATYRDVFLVLGDVAEAPEDRDTADGRPATREKALGRLARSLCADRTELSDEELERYAVDLADAHVQRIRVNAWRAAGGAAAWRRLSAVLYAGSGAFTADRLHPYLSRYGARRVDLAALFTPRVSDCAAAYAVARLCEERCA